MSIRKWLRWTFLLSCVFLLFSFLPLPAPPANELMFVRPPLPIADCLMLFKQQLRTFGWRALIENDEQLSEQYNSRMAILVGTSGSLRDNKTFYEMDDADHQALVLWAQQMRQSSNNHTHK